MTPADLRAWRLDADLTQPEAADQLGVTCRTYQRWERGEVPIPGPVAGWVRYHKRYGPLPGSG